MSGKWSQNNKLSMWDVFSGNLEDFLLFFWLNFISFLPSWWRERLISGGNASGLLIMVLTLIVFYSHKVCFNMCSHVLLWTWLCLYQFNRMVATVTQCCGNKFKMLCVCKHICILHRQQMVINRKQGYIIYTNLVPQKTSSHSVHR